MRLPKLTSAVLLVTAFVGIVSNAEVIEDPQELSSTISNDDDFAGANNANPRNCTTLNLACNGVIIDSIRLWYRPVLWQTEGMEASSNNQYHRPHHHHHGYQHHPKHRHHKYKYSKYKQCHGKEGGSCSIVCIKTNTINMDTPCSRTPPKICAVSADDWSEDEEEEEEEEEEGEKEETTPTENVQIDEEEHDATPSTDSSSGGSNQEFAIPGRPRRGGKSSSHPWAGLCVNVGTLCGDRLFGYNFKLTGIYTCDVIGNRPVFVKNCATGCNAGSCVTVTTYDPLKSRTDPPAPRTATTTASQADVTAAPKCIPLIKPIKDLISQTIDKVENLPLGPEASQLLKIALGTNLSSYFDNGVDAAGSTAALLAALIPQIEDVLKNTQSSLGPALGAADPAFQALYGILDQFTQASADLAACTGAKVDCTGLVVLSGYAIKIGVPILRAYLTVKFPPAAVAFLLLQPTIDQISDGLIAGNDAGLSDLINTIVDATTGVAGNFLPAPLKAILGITTPILNIIKNCNSTSGSIDPIPTPTNGVLTTTRDPAPITRDPAPITRDSAPTKAIVTTASAATATTTPKCVPLIKPIEDLISQVINMVENLPLGPEESRLLQVALGTNLSSYFNNGIDTAGSTAALLAALIPQIEDVLKNTQSSLGPVLGFTDPGFQVLYEILDQFTKASADLAACTGTKVDCTGLVVLTGYGIKIGLPILRAYLTVKFPPAAVALLLLQPTIDQISNGLIAGNDAGISDLIKTIVDATTGVVGSVLPAPLKAILGVTTPILSIIKNCNSASGSIDPAPTRTNGLLPTTRGPAPTSAIVTTTASAAIATMTPNCIPLIKPIEDLISQAISTVENLPLGPEASQLLQVALGTNLSSYFNNGVDTAGSAAALLASIIPQIEDVLKNTQSSLGPVLGIADPAFQVLYGILDQFTQASADLAACTGAKVNCTGLVVLAGYAIKIGVPILRAYLTVKFPPAAVAFLLLQPTIDQISDGLIAGNDAGLSELVTTIVNATTGVAGSLLPAPLTAILGIVAPIMNIIKNCPS